VHQTPPEAEDLLSTPAAGPAAVRGGATRVAGFFVSSVLSVFAAAILFRHLGGVGVGRYVTIFSLVAIVGGISDLGLTQLGIRELSITPVAGRGALARDLLGLRIALVFALVAYSWTIFVGVAIAGVGLILQAAQDNYGAMLQVDLRFGWVAALDVLRQLATAALVVGLVLLDAHLLALVSVYVWAGLLVLVIAGLLVRGQRSLLPAFDLRRSARLLRLVAPFSAAMIAATLYPQEAVVLVGLISNQHQLGEYAASFRVIQGLTAVPALVVGAALPIFARAARDDRARFDYAIGRVFEVAVVVGGAAAVGVAVGAPLAIEIIGGAGFRDAAGVLAIQSVALGASFVGSLWGNGLLSQGRYRELVALNTAGAVLLAGVLAVLVSLDGARGAAIAVSLLELGMAVAGGLLLCRGGRVGRPGLGVVAKVALAGAVGLLPGLWTGAPDAARLVLAVGLYGAVILLTRALPAEVDGLLPARLRAVR
jgi:O-antigen/teichoic acid export membrane protein